MAQAQSQHALVVWNCSDTLESQTLVPKHDHPKSQTRMLLTPERIPQTLNFPLPPSHTQPIQTKQKNKSEIPKTSELIKRIYKSSIRATIRVLWYRGLVTRIGVLGVLYHNYNQGPPK